jgi:hypothetical protein
LKCQSTTPVNLEAPCDWVKGGQNSKLKIVFSVSGTLSLGELSSLMLLIIGKLYGDVDHVEERHRHRYEVNPEMVPKFEEQGMRFVGHDVDGTRMEIMELKGVLLASSLSLLSIVLPSGRSSVLHSSSVPP